MWLVGREPVDIFVGWTEGGVSSMGQPTQWIAYSAVEAGLDMLLEAAAFQPKSRWRRRVPVRIWLSGALARPFMLGPIAGLKGWREVQEFANAAAPEAVGLDSPCAVQVEAWPQPDASLAIAMKASLLDLISAKALARGLRTVSIRPWWAEAANAAHAKAATVRLISISDPDSMILLGGQSGRFDSATSYLPRTSADQTERLLSRLALVLGSTTEETLRIRLAATAEAATLDVPFGAIEGSA